MSLQDDLDRRWLDGIDPKLLVFLQTRVNSFIKWDLVRFFHENPHTVDTAENIARYTGRDGGVVAAALEELAQAGVVQSSEVADLTVFTLATTEEIRALLDRFALACEDRQFRIKAIYHMIQGMQ